MRSVVARAALFASPVLFASLAACSSARSGTSEETASAANVKPTTSLTLPVPGSTGNRISAADQKIIVQAWLQAKHDYYDTQDGYAGFKNATGQIVMSKPAVGNGQGDAAPYSEVASVPCPAYYSDLVCHFYQHMPSYKQVIPNVRGCFSVLANGGLKVPDASAPGGQRAAVYPEMFDYCLYQEYDAVKGGRPNYDLASIGKNKASGNEVGVLQYLGTDGQGTTTNPNLRIVFQYIMYTWYEPRTFDAGDQAAILAAVYQGFGAQPPAARPGLSAHPDSANIINAITSYFGGNYTLGAPASAPTPTPTPTPAVAPTDATCRAQTTKQACGSCCGTVHASAYQKIAAPLAQCACSASVCAQACAASVCASTPVEPDVACAQCLLANPACSAQAQAAASACAADAACTAEQACFSGCASKP